MSKRHDRSTCVSISAVRGTALLLALAAVAACADNGGTLDDAGEVNGLRVTVAGETVDRSLGSATLAHTTTNSELLQDGSSPEYRFEPGPGGRAAASNPAQRLGTELTDGALQVWPDTDDPDWSLQLRWTGVGRRQDIRSVGRPVAGATVEGELAFYHRPDGSEEWYLNGPRGIEQGFTLSERPPGDQSEMVIEIAVRGGLVPELSANGRWISLRTESGKHVLRYANLVAFDAKGEQLAAWLQVQNGTIRLVVNDAGASYPLLIDPLVFVQRDKLVPDDGHSVGGFGASVALSGDTALVGAGNSVYLFDRADGAWTQQQKLQQPDGAHNDGFGRSVALSGDTALVGAFWDDDLGMMSGSAYVFVRNGSDWIAQQKLLPSDGFMMQLFGSSVALSGDTALVGAGAPGAAYVFVRSDGVWTEQQKLVAGDGAQDDHFGCSVSLSGDTALVGALGDDDKGSSSGSAYVFVRSDGVWTEQQKLLAIDATVDDRFGSSVALNDDTALVSAPGRDGLRSVYVFVRNGAVWTQQQKLLPSDTAENERFGSSLALTGDTALVSAPPNPSEWHGPRCENGVGASYVFTRNGSLWSLLQRLRPDDSGGCGFGSSVAINDDTALVGMSEDDERGTGAGATYVFALTAMGEPCPQDGECEVGYCVDGVCCATTCGGGDANDCEACSVAAGAATDGVCGPVTNDPECAPWSDFDRDDGCGCRVPAGGRPSPWGAFGSLGLGLIWLRRRTTGRRGA